jgi:uncharacterized phage protein gp47/JayE
MASLQTYTFSQLVNGIATATQAASTSLLDFGVGSIMRALSQAVSGVILWLQAIILQTLTLTRAATSVGADLDSFYADYGFSRLSANASTGQVTFSRFTATQQAVVPVGATVQTTDGSQTFTVTLDTTNSAYSATLAGYVLPINTASVNVPVQANVAGAAGNVQANTITLITSGIPAVDTVTNSAAFTNGNNAESDAASRIRFVLFIASLSKATKAAVNAAVLGIQQGLNDTITENYQYNGTYQPGFFYVVVDDGTGNASSGLLSSVGSAVDAVRPICSTFAVFAPTILTANVSMLITSASGYNHATVVGNVGLALTAFINALTLGQSLPFTQLASVAYGVAGVANATSITLNSGTTDLVASNQQVIVAGTMTIS